MTYPKITRERLNEIVQSSAAKAALDEDSREALRTAVGAVGHIATGSFVYTLPNWETCGCPLTEAKLYNPRVGVFALDDSKAWDFIDFYDQAMLSEYPNPGRRLRILEVTG